LRVCTSVIVGDVFASLFSLGPKLAYSIDEIVLRRLRIWEESVNLICRPKGMLLRVL